MEYAGQNDSDFARKHGRNCWLETGVTVFQQICNCGRNFGQSIGRELIDYMSVLFGNLPLCHFLNAVLHTVPHRRDFDLMYSQYE